MRAADSAFEKPCAILHAVCYRRTLIAESEALSARFSLENKAKLSLSSGNI
jgi:hypothetical protein